MMVEYTDKTALVEKIANIRVHVAAARQTGKSLAGEVLHMYRDAVLEAIREAPDADVAEVKHAYNKNDVPSQFECSACGWCCWDTYNGDTDEYNFCPNCGAKMDGEEVTDESR